MQAHYERLLSEIGRINPDLVESVAVTLPPSPKMPPVSGLTAALNEAGVGDAEELGESRLSKWSSEGRPTDTTERKRAPGLGHPSNLSNLPGTTASYGRGAHARLGSVRNTQGDDVVDGREIDARANGMGAGQTFQALTRQNWVQHAAMPRKNVTRTCTASASAALSVR